MTACGWRRNCSKAWRRWRRIMERRSPAAKEKGTGVIFGDPIDNKSQAGVRNDSRPLFSALSDGEDFELILAVPPEDAARMIAEQPLTGLRLTDIGQFIAEPGLWETI